MLGEVSFKIADRTQTPQSNVQSTIMPLVRLLNFAVALKSLRSFGLYFSVAIAACCLLSDQLAAQGESGDIIRGTVTDSHNQPVKDALILVLDGGIEIRQARSGKDGRFSVIVRGGTGTYLIEARALGMAVTRRSIQRSDDNTTLIADIKMDVLAPKSGNTLSGVNVAGTREKPSRNQTEDESAGSNEQSVSTQGSRLSPAYAQDMNRLLEAATAGRLLDDGISFLGQDPSQNKYTFNGIEYSGTMLPMRGTRLSVTTASFDPSKGGFSGGLISVNTQSGSIYAIRQMSLSYDGPLFRSKSSNFSNAPIRRGSVNYFGWGPLKNKSRFYNFSIQFNQENSAVASLNRIVNSALPAASNSNAPTYDSLNNFYSVLNAKLPLGAKLGTEPSYISRTFATHLRLDFTSPRSNRGSNLVVRGQHSVRNGLGTISNGFLSRTANMVNTTGALQYSYSDYIGNFFLHEMQFGVSATRSLTRPELLAPAISVSVNDQSSDGTSFNQFLFGGSGSGNAERKAIGINHNNTLSWFSPSNKHQIKLSSNVQLNTAHEAALYNSIGQFHFNSIEDLANNTPTSFVRTLEQPQSRATVFGSSVSIGDSWRYSDNISFQFGARLDYAQSLRYPEKNFLLDSSLSIRNDYAPKALIISPRLGFKRRFFNSESADIQTDAARSSTKTTLSGGIGVFASDLTPDMVMPSMAYTGIRDNYQTLKCYGDNTPTLNWNSILGNTNPTPSTCVDESSGNTFAQRASIVNFMSNGFKPPKALRSTLNFEHITDAASFSVSATYSNGYNERDIIDRNFDTTSKFAMNTEANRPVYVNASSILSPSGVIAIGGSRRLPEFFGISEVGSTGKSIARELSFSMSLPNILLASSAHSYAVRYILSDQKTYRSGFSSTTVGNPVTGEWGRGSGDIRHIVRISASSVFNGFSIMAFGTIRSGMPFTPIVGSDINGDGYMNDRAYIGADVMDRLPELSARARSCIKSQMNQMSRRNSCTGPWSQSLDLNFRLDGARIGLPRRISVTTYLSDVLGGADQLLHGQNRMRGWGVQQTVSPILLTPSGFDHTSQSFQYDIDKNFGAPLSFRGKRSSNFRLAISATIRLGPNLASRSAEALRNQLTQVESVDSQAVVLKTSLKKLGSHAPYVFMMLRQSYDSLDLSPDQITRLDSAQRLHRIQSESFVDSLVDSLVRSHKIQALFESTGTSKMLVDITAKTNRAMDNIFYQTSVPIIKSTLSADQMSKLSEYIRIIINVQQSYGDN